MLRQISWYDYILYSFSLLGIYYAIVLISYFRKDIGSLLSRKQVAADNSLRETLHEHEEMANPGPSVLDPLVLEQLFSQAMALSEAIKSIFQEINFQEGTQDELFVLLRKKIKEYPALQATAFRVAIQNLIQTEAIKYEMEWGHDKGQINDLWGEVG